MNPLCTQLSIDVQASKYLEVATSRAAALSSSDSPVGERADLQRVIGQIQALGAAQSKSAEPDLVAAIDRRLKSFRLPYLEAMAKLAQQGGDKSKRRKGA